MTTRTLSLTKEGHQYVFRYAPGSEIEVIDEISRVAARQDATLDCLDVAALSFQVARDAAIECCATLTPVSVSARTRAERGAGTNHSPGEAKDGPCANCP